MGVAGLVSGSVAMATTPPNTPVINTATATYSVAGKVLSVSASSAVNTSARTPSSIALFGAVPGNAGSAQATHVNVGACMLGTGSNNWQTQTSLTSAFAGTIGLPNTINLEPSNTFVGRDVVMIAVSDPDQNRDPLTVEYVTVEIASASDRETLQLAETGPGTGYFVGWVQLTRKSTSAGDCRLSVGPNETLRARYTDRNDGEDTVIALGLVDPYGLVFNSLTGEPVNGAQVTLLNAQTGQPAAVFGDDGLSSYPSLVVSGQSVTDASGLVYTQGPGRYRFPLVAPGLYRIVVTPPEGYSFPSVVPETSIRKVLGDGATIAPGSKGESFSVPIGPPTKMDVPLDPRAGRLLLSKTANRASAAVGEFIRYELNVRNADQQKVRSVELHDRLPRGLRYRTGSARDESGRPLGVQQDSDGRTLHISAGDLEGASSRTVSYVVEVSAATPLAPAVNEANATAIGARSDAATATVQILDDMMLSRAILVGTVSEGGCPASDLADRKKAPQKGLANARVILQDGRFAITDSNGKWHMEGILPGTTMVRLDPLSLPKGQVVMPCTPDPRRSAGYMAKTLDVRPGSLNRVDYYTLGPKVMAPPVAAPIAVPGAEVSDALRAAEDTVFRRMDPTPAWAFPADGHVPPQGFQSLMVSHGAGERVVLELNGKPVPGFHFEGTKASADGKIVTSLWRNVHLENGENRFVAKVFGRDRTLVAELPRTLILATAPVRAELVPGQSRLVANGRDNPVILVRLLDARDQPVRPDITGEFSLGAPYVLKDTADSIAKNPLAPVLGAAPRYVVGNDGIAAITLAPTTNSGEVELQFNFASGRSQILRAWLQADQREWIVVGFAEGSPVGQKLRQSMQAASGLTADAPEIQGQRLALYAKGTIKGDALLTIAYDSAKPSTAVGTSPQGIPVAPFYTVYSDQSQGGLEASSWGKLFLKIEKSTFVALLGNSNTGLSQTELGRYVRAMYGLKSSWQGGRLSYTAFAMRNLTSFHRDLIRADGTTGSWQLANQTIVPLSEKVRVLVRDRLDAGNILSERFLTRMADYTLDYTSGRFLLALPVASFDAALNPVTIEVEYATENFASNSHTLGARVAFKATPGVEVGVTMIQDNDAARGGKLGAVDLKAKLGTNTEVRVEAGASSRLDAGSTVRGNAFLAEVRHERADLTARAYFRRAASGYGLNEQPVSTADLQSVGADVRMRLSENWRVETQLSHQERLSAGQTADVVQGRVNYSANAWQSSLGLRLGQEKDGRGGSTGVAQVLAGLGYLSPDQKWSLRGATEVGKSHGDAIFPNRLTIEGDYRLTPKLSLTAGQTWTFASTHSSALLAGLRYQPWTGGEVQTGLSHRSWADGENTAAKMSLVQSSRLDQAWTLNGQISAARRVAGNPFTANVSGVGNNGSTAASTAPGSSASASASTTSLDDFTTASLSLAYSREPWSGFVRLEKRWADDARHSLAGGLSRKFGDGEHVLATARFENFAGDRKPSSMLSLVHASRRQASPWTLLYRVDWIDNNHTGSVATVGSTSPAIGVAGPVGTGTTAGQVSTTGRRAMVSAHWNYLAPNGFEWLSHAGFKRVLESIDDQTYGSRFAMFGTELRMPLNKYFDVGVHGSHAVSFSGGISNTAYGVSVGVRPVENTLITVGYNFRGIKDTDFYAGNQRAKGLFIWARVLFDENLLGLSRPAAAAMAQGPR